MTANRSIACFVSPHGFGHAARASAVLGELHRRMPSLDIHIFTRVPIWFFKESLAFPFAYHELETDVGMVQISPLREDVDATVARLDAFLDFTPGKLDAIAAQLHALGCVAALCDISPLGIAAARHAGIPSVLVENFLWDWIYEGYVADNPRMAEHGARMADIFAMANRHVLTEPVCVSHKADLVAPPVSRACRATPAQTRQALGVDPGERLVLVSMGGVRTEYAFLDELGRHDHCVFMLPMDNATEVVRRGTVIVLPWHSTLYHPDLVAASDVVVGKLGYSTIAEVYNGGTAFGYFTRPRFRESGMLQAFVDRTIASVHLPEESYATGSWVKHIEPLLAAPRAIRTEPNGAVPVAELVRKMLNVTEHSDPALAWTG